MRHRKCFAAFTKTLFFGFILMMLLFIAIKAEGVIEAVQGALLLCYRTVVPTLFPFFVLSAMLAGSGFSDILARVLSPFMKPLFHISGGGALPFVIGLLSGYPTGAKVTASLCENGRLSKEEGAHLLAFCNNSGPLFIIGAIGTGMLGSTSIGVYLYILHIISAVLVGFSLRFFSTGIEKHPADIRQKCHQKSYLELFTDSVSDSVGTVLKVCGYIALFAAFTACFSPFFDRYLPASVALVLKGILEVTNGVFLASQAEMAPRFLLTLISFLTGFGGICVWMQVAAVTHGVISLKIYLPGKLLQGIYAALLTYLTYPFCVHALRPVSVSGGSGTTLILSLPPVVTVLPVLALFIYVALRLKLHAKRMKQ